MKAINSVNNGLLVFMLMIGATALQAWIFTDSNTAKPGEKVSGTVFSNRDCGCFIRHIDGDLELAFKPLNLDKKFCREGQKILFQFEYVDTLDYKPPFACSELIPVKVFNVEKVVQSAKTSFP